MTADDGIRTRDLRFTKPLLYQLSYVGTSGKDAIRRLAEQARTCSRFAVRSANQALQTRAASPIRPGTDSLTQEHAGDFNAWRVNGVWHLEQNKKPHRGEA